jgi:hypothetical protein
MRKRVYIALAVLLIVLAGMSAWQGLRLREPVYQGRPLIVWIKEGNSGSLPRDKAIQAVLAVGTNAFPWYVEWLETAHDSRVKIKVYDMLNKLPWLRHSFFNKGQFSYEIRRVCGSCGLSIWGEEAKPAIPALTHLLDKGDVHQRDVAAHTLALIGPEGMQPLANFLGNSNSYTRAVAAEALGDYATAENFWSNRKPKREEIESAARIIVPILIPFLRDGSPRVQAGVIQSLGRFAREPEIVIPSLAELVRNSNDKMVRYSAIVALQEYEAKTESVVSALVQALQDQNFEVRLRATIALKKIDPEAAAKAGVK